MHSSQLWLALIGFFSLGNCSALDFEKLSKDQREVRMARANELFKAGCERSGEFIHRVVPQVDGVLLLKLRPTEHSPYDQNAIDPYGYDFDWTFSDGRPPPYIATFLIGKDENGHFQETKPIVKPGYKYVETIDPDTRTRYRYTGKLKDVTHTSSILMGGDGKTKFVTKDFVVEKALSLAAPPRYGVTYDDISTEEERNYWIAGSSLKVIDLKTNEVIAERIGYMIDFAQGVTPRGRQPWTFARRNKGWSCPHLGNQSYGARRFVEKVLLIAESKE